MDKAYLVILASALGHESEHKFNAESRELAARAALVKYPYHHVKSVDEVMNYENATDKELELKLCELLNVHNDDKSYFENENLINLRPRFCSDWNETMPLAVDSGLSITTELQCVTVSNYAPDAYLDDESERISIICIGREYTLRAIVICLIKVLESNNGN